MIDPKLIDQAVASRNFGRPSARRTGSNPSWPWVAVIDFGEQAVGVHRTHTETLKGLAFKTRAEAMARADGVIEHRTTQFRKQLQDPRYRALRAQYGLPKEIENG